MPTFVLQLSCEMEGVASIAPLGEEMQYTVDFQQSGGDEVKAGVVVSMDEEVGPGQRERLVPRHTEVGRQDHLVRHADAAPRRDAGDHGGRQRTTAARRWRCRRGRDSNGGLLSVSGVR